MAFDISVVVMVVVIRAFPLRIRRIYILGVTTVTAGVDTSYHQQQAGGCRQ